MTGDKLSTRLDYWQARTRARLVERKPRPGATGAFKARVKVRGLGALFPPVRANNAEALGMFLHGKLKTFLREWNVLASINIR
jgi:hypothetical protein